MSARCFIYLESNSLIPSTIKIRYPLPVKTRVNGVKVSQNSKLITNSKKLDYEVKKSSLIWRRESKKYVAGFKIAVERQN